MPLLHLVFRRKRIPEVDDPVFFYAAVDLAELIRTKKVIFAVIDLL